MTRSAAKRRPGFTLIELLVVIAIMGILAALALSAASRARISNQIRVARASGMRLAQAIDAYKAQQGFLPLSAYNAETDDEDTYENVDLVRQINGVMNREPFLELSVAEKNANGSFKDPWGRPFRVVMWKESSEDPYRYFQVYSCGLNKKWELGWDDPTLPDKPDDIAPKH